MRVSFNELPRPVRERLLRITAAPADPLVLARGMGGSDGFVVLVVVGVLALLAFLGAIGAVLQQDGMPWELFAVMVPAGLVASWTAAALALRRRWPLPPLGRNDYVIGVYYVGAFDGMLTLVPLWAIVGVEAVHHLRGGSYRFTKLDLRDREGQHHFVSLYTKEAAAAAISRMEDARARHAAARAAGDAAAMAALDPFHECTTSGSFGDGAKDMTGPRAVLRPGWVGPAIFALGVLATLLVVLPIAFVASGRRSAALQRTFDAERKAGRAKEIAQFEEKAAGKAAASFMAAALTRLDERRDNTMFVRLRGPDAAALARVDRALAEAKATKGAVPVGPGYPAAVKSAAADLAPSLEQALDGAFPAQSFGEHRVSVKTATTDAEMGNAPRVEITVEVRAGRDAYKAQGRTKAYGAVATTFRVVVSIPGKAERLTLEHVVPPPALDTLTGKRYAANQELWLQSDLFSPAYKSLSPKLRALFVKPGY